MIAICTPTRGLVHARYAIDLVCLMKRAKDVAYAIAEGSLLPNLRTMLVEGAQKAGASHVLFIDSDMRFPDDTLDRLLAHDVDIVGVNCAQRMTDAPTARGLDGQPFSKKGLHKVGTIGFGVTLIKIGVFEKVVPPWFAMPFDGRRFVGEDIFFCQQARDAGLDVWADGDIKVGHIGEVEHYRH